MQDFLEGRAHGEVRTGEIEIELEVSNVPIARFCDGKRTDLEDAIFATRAPVLRKLGRAQWRARVDRDPALGELEIALRGKSRAVLVFLLHAVREVVKSTELMLVPDPNLLSLAAGFGAA